MNVAKGLVGVLAWALIAFGISYIGFGMFNDLNWGAPWACPGPFFPAEWTPIDCILSSSNTLAFPLGEVFLGTYILVAGIVLLLVDKMVIQK
jgi:hypothetical protein